MADPLEGLVIEERPGAVFFGVHVAPGARSEGVRGTHGPALRMLVRSRPEKGRANLDVTGLLSAVLGLKRPAVEIVSGHTSRAKRVKVSGATAAEVRARLQRALPAASRRERERRL